MVAELNRVKVVIDEEVYELTSPSGEEHIQTVARYIDKKIKEIYAVKSEAAINARLKTLFISLNIADDLFKERGEREAMAVEMDKLREEVAGCREEIHGLKEKNGALNQQIFALKAELDEAKNELEEYIEVFEINDAMKKGKLTKLQRP